MLIETVVKLAAKALITLAGCALCLLYILPLYGGYNYAIGGICTGAVAGVIAAWYAAYPTPLSLIEPPLSLADTAMTICVIAGITALSAVFWPMVVIAGIAFWIRISWFGGGDGPSRPAVV